MLEGLTQALAHTGQRVVVAHSLSEAEEIQGREAAVLTVVERGLVTESDPGRAFVRTTMAGGGALVTYREAGDTSRALPAPIARHVLADLVLPLERNRLLALAEAVSSRAKVVGREADVTPRNAPPS